MSLTTELTMRIVAQQVGSNDLGTVTFDLNKNDKTNMATGTESGVISLFILINSIYGVPAVGL